MAAFPVRLSYEDTVPVFVGMEHCERVVIVSMSFALNKERPYVILNPEEMPKVAQNLTEMCQCFGRFHMDPLTTVLIALGTGASVQAMATTTNGKAKEIYQDLRARISRRFEDKKVNDLALAEYEQELSMDSRKQLKKALVDADVVQDEEIVQMARNLLDHIEPEQAPEGQYKMLPRGIVQGYNQGTHQVLIMDFGSESRVRQKFD
jgi:nucleoside diphosphate kinase